MSGETDLSKMLATLSPSIDPTLYVFLCFEGAKYGDYAELQAVASIQEKEGLTLVVPKLVADQKAYEYEGVYQAITLQVHSSLLAVGLTAAFAKKLTEHNISANVIAGFYHDHIFVPVEDAQSALNALRELSSE